MHITKTNLTKKLPREENLLELFEVPLNISTKFQCLTPSDVEGAYKKVITFRVKGEIIPPK